jgi:hypothetical protein
MGKSKEPQLELIERFKSLINSGDWEMRNLAMSITRDIANDHLLSMFIEAGFIKIASSYDSIEDIQMLAQNRDLFKVNLKERTIYKVDVYTWSRSPVFIQDPTRILTLKSHNEY